MERAAGRVGRRPDRRERRAIADEDNVGEFFSDPVFADKFKQLDAVSKSEFHIYRVGDLVLPGVVKG